jgi:hypothetical protein
LSGDPNSEETVRQSRSSIAWPIIGAVAAILAIWAGLATLNTLFLVPGDGFLSPMARTAMAAMFALISVLFGLFAKWCFAKRNRRKQE